MGIGTSAHRAPQDVLLRCLKQAERDAGTRTDGLTTTEKDELAALRRENRRLREDVDILKRATAFFAKETR